MLILDRGDLDAHAAERSRAAQVVELEIVGQIVQADARARGRHAELRPRAVVAPSVR